MIFSLEECPILKGLSVYALLLQDVLSSLLFVYRRTLTEVADEVDESILCRQSFGVQNGASNRWLPKPYLECVKCRKPPVMIGIETRNGPVVFPCISRFGQISLKSNGQVEDDIAHLLHLHRPMKPEQNFRFKTKPVLRSESLSWLLLL